MVCVTPLLVGGAALSNKMGYRGANNGIYEVHQVRCGQCMPCRIYRRSIWTLRLIHEMTVHRVARFITLTYSPEFLPKDGNLEKRDFQLFMKRLRKLFAKEKRKIRFYACGEYGSKGNRPHFHAIIFGMSYNDNIKLKKAWTKGFVDSRNVTEGRMKYVAGYVEKKLLNVDYKKNGLNLPFSLMSQGIGRDWCDKNVDLFTEWFEKPFKVLVDKVIKDVKGKVYPTPRYYRNRWGCMARSLIDGTIHKAREEAYIKAMEVLNMSDEFIRHIVGYKFYNIASDLYLFTKEVIDYYDQIIRYQILQNGLNHARVLEKRVKMKSSYLH